jgi:hypothetical protein
VRLSDAGKRHKNNGCSENDFHAGDSGLWRTQLPLCPIGGSANEPMKKPAEMVDGPRAGNSVDWQTCRKLGGMELKKPIPIPAL